MHKGLSKKKKWQHQQSTVFFTNQKGYETQPSQIILAKQNTFLHEFHIKYKKYNNSYIRIKKIKTEHDSRATPKGVKYTTISNEYVKKPIF